MNEQDMKIFWEQCPPRFAHLDGGHTMNRRRLVVSLGKTFEKSVKAEEIDGKVIADYGCGGGHLGQYLLGNYNIEKYIGIDMAERSLNKAAISLERYQNIEFKQSPIDFSTLNADIFVSISVIQHFPNKEYLDNFLENINTSKIPKVLLHIRSKSTQCEFLDDYSSQRKVALCCYVHGSYIRRKLSAYKAIGQITKQIKRNRRTKRWYRKNRRNATRKHRRNTTSGMVLFALKGLT